MSLSTMRRIQDKSTREFNSKLFVSRSALKDAGNGLFSLKKIKKGDYICEYFGRYVRKVDVDNNVEDKHYCVGPDDNDNVIISAMLENGDICCAAGYINDILNDIETNCEFIWANNRCFIRACQDIEVGEELYISYGAEYQPERGLGS